MTSDSDEALSRARGTLDRVRLKSFDDLATLRPSRRQRGTAKKRLILIAAVNAAILLVAGTIGVAGFPLGMFGALAVMMLMIAVTLVIAMAPVTRPVTYEKLARSDIKALPAQTTRWLDTQRPALPAPAVQIADRIGARLDTLGLQLANVGNDSPAAADVRRLVGEQLPEFVRDYQRVPVPLRGPSATAARPIAS